MGHLHFTSQVSDVNNIIHLLQVCNTMIEPRVNSLSKVFKHCTESYITHTLANNLTNYNIYF